MKIFWGIILLALLFLVACSKTSSVPELSFTVNEELLSEAVIDSIFNYSYQPPKGWESANDVIMEAISFQLNKKDSDLLRNLHVFIAPEQKGFLAGSVILDDALQANSRFITSLEDKYPQMQFGEYTSGKLYFYQYMFTNENNFVNIKLLIPLAEMQTAMFDIFIDKDYYNEQVRTVESVIGSIKKYNL